MGISSICNLTDTVRFVFGGGPSSTAFSPGVSQAPGVASPFTQTDCSTCIRFTFGIYREAPDGEPRCAGSLHTGLAPLGPRLETTRPLIGRMRNHPPGTGAGGIWIEAVTGKGAFKAGGGTGQSLALKTCQGGPN
ncbi:hypothetical protein PO909_029927 [Leuciscus waleckii]